MKTATLVLISLGAALVALGPPAAQTMGPEHARDTGRHPAPSAAVERDSMALTLSAPRAVQVDGLAVGDRLDPARLHVITRPGLYGLGGRGAGDRFGIIDGMLVRFDPASLRLKSIIRTGVAQAD